MNFEMDVRLVRKPDNKYDVNAVRIESDSGVHLGYVPKELCTQITDFHHYTCKIISVYYAWYKSTHDLCPVIMVEYKENEK